MISKILVSGASGLIGSALVSSLRSSGAEVAQLARFVTSPSPTAASEIVRWDPAQPIAPETVSGFDAVIHLAGESIVGRWSAEKKAKIRDSRVIGTRNLVQALVRAGQKSQLFICASAIGYYGDRADEVLTEESLPGTGFMTEVCKEWEAATQPVFDAGIRTVLLRTGIVLSAKGGALAKMLLPFKLGLGGRVGDGCQWMSWIDLQDMVGAIHHILKTDLLQGPVNMVAPKPVTNAEFSKTLAGALSRPAIFPMPPFVIKLLFGEMGETVLLGSQRVEPTKLIASGYPFRFRELRASLEKILKQ
jgi:uncharacterized protein (TIGR01777 family)